MNNKPSYPKIECLIYVHPEHKAARLSPRQKEAAMNALAAALNLLEAVRHFQNVSASADVNGSVLNLEDCVETVNERVRVLLNAPEN